MLPLLVAAARQVLQLVDDLRDPDERFPAAQHAGLDLVQLHANRIDMTRKPLQANHNRLHPFRHRLEALLGRLLRNLPLQILQVRLQLLERLLQAAHGHLEAIERLLRALDGLLNLVEAPLQGLARIGHCQHGLLYGLEGFAQHPQGVVQALQRLLYVLDRRGQAEYRDVERLQRAFKLVDLVAAVLERVLEGFDVLFQFFDGAFEDLEGVFEGFEGVFDAFERPFVVFPAGDVLEEDAGRTGLLRGLLLARLLLFGIRGAGFGGAVLGRGALHPGGGVRPAVAGVGALFAAGGRAVAVLGGGGFRAAIAVALRVFLFLAAVFPAAVLLAGVLAALLRRQPLDVFDRPREILARFLQAAEGVLQGPDRFPHDDHEDPEEGLDALRQLVVPAALGFLALLLLLLAVAAALVVLLFPLHAPSVIVRFFYLNQNFDVTLTFFCSRKLNAPQVSLLHRPRG